MRADDTTRTIPLTKGRVALVDAADHEMLSHYHWCMQGSGYALAAVGSGRGGARILMHRLIMLPDPRQQVDHINGNKLDNRRANLRLCSAAQNKQNADLLATNTSGFKGVSWNRDCHKWQAHIRADGRSLYLGVFATKDEAARAYDTAARHHFGEFARLNFEEG